MILSPRPHRSAVHRASIFLFSFEMQSYKLSDNWRFMSPCDYKTKVLITLHTVLLIQVFYLIETIYLIETLQVDRNLDACLSLVPQVHSSDPAPPLVF